MAKFTDIFIKRPVMATVISLLILILGARALFVMPLRQFPKMDNTVITITTVYPGASANLVQGFITTPIEKNIAGADGIDYITSNSDDSVSTITAYVKLGFDPNVAFTNIMSRVSQVKSQLPQAAQDPVIVKKTGSAFSLLYEAFNSKVMTPQEITAYIRQVVQPNLETLPGVAQVNILGGATYAMRIWLNPKKMAALKITPSQVRSALIANNFQTAAGQVKGRYILMSVRANTDLQNVKGFRDLVIKSDSKSGSVVRLRDVARVELGSQSYDSSVYFNNKKAVFISVDPTPTANPLTVISKVLEMMPKLQKNYPTGLSSHLVYDATKFIKASIYEVTRTIIEAAIIVILIIFLFLGSIRSVIIPVVTIPLSLIGVFGAMLLMGYSINLLTLLALVLAIGLVVDDAIVVVENTYRHLAEGMSPFDAAIQGAREIATPIISMTITLAAVYAPIGFIGGVTGGLFSEFAFTLAAAVIISGVIALTLSPMMCSKFLHSNLLESKLVTTVDTLFERMVNFYKGVLTGVLSRRKIVSGFAVGVLVSCVFLYLNAPKEMAPYEDQGVLLSLITGPKYANIDYMNKFAKPLEAIYDKIPAKQDQMVINGMGAVNSGMSLLMLKPWGERKEGEAAVFKTLSKQVKTIAGNQVVSIRVPPLPSSGGGMPIQFELLSTGNYQQLYNLAKTMQMKAMQSGRFLFIVESLKYNKPIVNLHINRSLVSLLGMNMQTVAGDLASALGGNYSNYFSMGNRSYEVIPQLDRSFRSNADQLNNLYLTTPNNGLVPISSVASLSYDVMPNSLTRFNQLNSVTLQGVPMPGTTEGDALGYLQSLAKKTLPSNVSYDYAGQSREYIQEGNVLMYAFIFSLIIIFLVLAAQFESFSLPLVVMTSVPMAICGALLPLNWFLKSPLVTVNIYTQIGLITLIGLISKHGILMVDFANKLRAQSDVSRFDAIVKAACVRLRPVLMTTAAMILGVMPLLLASGAGAVSRFDIGLTVASGMFIGTMFTLLVVPTMYLLKARHILSILLSAALISGLIYFFFYFL